MNATPLVVHLPRGREAERAWVCELLFTRWLGLAIRIEAHERPEVRVELPGGGELLWADSFFSRTDPVWLQPASLPAAPALRWPIADPDLRERVGQDHLAYWFGDGHFEHLGTRLQLPIDITGSAFFMLSRYEEALRGAPADRHGRFPGRESLAERAGLSQRPLVDEWVELLWWALQRAAPLLRRKPRKASSWVSCDVDAPYSPGARSIPLALRQTASDLVNHRSPRQAARTLLNAAVSRVGIHRFDPFDTFDWMLDCNERAGQKLTFFFLSTHKPQRIDGGYVLDEPRIGALISRIVRRGHEIGLHGSYRSVDEPQRLAREFDNLKRAVRRAGGRQEAFGSRQHYLRFRMPDTARTLDTLGFEYDSTLGFADVAGFRCGTCRAYPLFDLTEGRALALLERPLVLMESTVISPTYLGLGHGDAAMALMNRLRDTCRRFGGEFALLWHNSHFTEPRAREMYEALIQPIG